MNVGYGSLVYIVDLNEVDRDGLAPLSLDFTATYGPYQLAPGFHVPPVGSTVRIVDDFGSTYTAEVARVDSARDFSVRIDWESEIPRIDEHWSATDAFLVDASSTTVGNIEPTSAVA